MKLSIAQALGTVLNIQIEVIQEESWYVIKNPGGFAATCLGKINEITMDQAIWKAVEVTSFKDECHFAIFPMGSNREDFYMAIERELLRQEASQEFQGQQMWERMGPDPRELITYIMGQLRECATSLTHPTVFQTNMLRVAVLVVASLQWASNWITQIKVREATLRVKTPEPPKVIPLPSVVEESERRD